MSIHMVPVRDIRPGDVFSTDGGIVLHKTLHPGSDCYTLTCVCHGVEKVATLPANDLLPVWDPRAT